MKIGGLDLDARVGLLDDAVGVLGPLGLTDGVLEAPRAMPE